MWGECPNILDVFASAAKQFQGRGTPQDEVLPWIASRSLAMTAELRSP